MRVVSTPHFIVLSTLALLLHSGSATADCIKPAWKDPQSLKHLDFQATASYEYEYQARLHEYIVCRRKTLELRASGLTPADVRQLVLRERDDEDRDIAALEWINSCLSFPKREADPAVARKQCDDFVGSGLEKRKPPKHPAYTVLKSEQRSAYGGLWTFRTLNMGRPGHCDDAPCDYMFAVDVTNTTPVALKCEVALTVSNRDDGPQRGEQTITLYPGDSVPAAKVQIMRSAESIEPEVTCSRAMPLVPARSVPASCALNWRPREYEFPAGLAREWESGIALLEFATQQGYKPPVAISVMHADSPAIGAAAQRFIEKMSFSSNCAGQRFRLRVEYRAFPCYMCMFESGVVTVLRDDSR